MAIAIIPSIILLSPYKFVGHHGILKPGLNGISNVNHVTRASPGLTAAPSSFPQKLGANQIPLGF